MKRMMMGLILLMTATAATAEWTRVDQTDEFVQYVDRATIRRNGVYVKMWDLMDFMKAVKSTEAGVYYLSIKLQREYDCKEEKVRIVAFAMISGQMGSGNVVYSYNEGGKWLPIYPRSVQEATWDVACGKK